MQKTCSKRTPLIDADASVRSGASLQIDFRPLISDQTAMDFRDFFRRQEISYAGGSREYMEFHTVNMERRRKHEHVLNRVLILFLLAGKTGSWTSKTNSNLIQNNMWVYRCNGTPDTLDLIKKIIDLYLYVELSRIRTYIASLSRLSVSSPLIFRSPKYSMNYILLV